MVRVGYGREEGHNDAVNKGAYTVTCATVDRDHREGDDGSQPGRFTLKVSKCRAKASEVKGRKKVTQNHRHMLMDKKA